MAGSTGILGLPRSISAPGLALAFALLTAGFVFFRFPYERLEEPIADLIANATGAEVRIGGLGPHLGLLGPGLRAESVVANRPGEPRQTFEHAVVRPAWSLSWFSGTPSIHLELMGDVGSAAGTLQLGDTLAWDGELRELDASLLPLADLLGGLGFSGRLNADLDISGGAAGEPPIIGTLKFDIHDGTLLPPKLPVALPFDTLSGEVVFGGESYAAIESLSIEGPMLRARLEGEIGNEPGGSASLDLVASLQTNSEPVRSLLSGYGVETDASGAASIHIGGTISRPSVRDTQ